MSSATTRSSPIDAAPEDRAAAPPAHVAIVRWPEEAASASRLRAVGTPRLLLVAPDASAPLSTDCDEDWIRLPALDEDVRVRVSALAARSARHGPRPETKGDRRISHRGRWVALSRTEEAIASALSDRFGEVVTSDDLAAAVRHQPLTNDALRVHLTRLRRRIGPLGLVVRTVRGSGWVLEEE